MAKSSVIVYGSFFSSDLQVGILSLIPLALGHGNWSRQVTPGPQSNWEGSSGSGGEFCPLQWLREMMWAHGCWCKVQPSRQNTHSREHRFGYEKWGCWQPPGSGEVLKAPGQGGKKNPESGLCRRLGDLWSDRGNRLGFGPNFNIHSETCIHVIFSMVVRMRGNRFSFYLVLMQRSNIEEKEFCQINSNIDSKDS